MHANPAGILLISDSESRVYQQAEELSPQLFEKHVAEAGIRS